MISPAAILRCVHGSRRIPEQMYAVCKCYPRGRHRGGMRVRTIIRNVPRPVRFLGGRSPTVVHCAPMSSGEWDRWVPQTGCSIGSLYSQDSIVCFCRIASHRSTVEWFARRIDPVLALSPIHIYETDSNKKSKKNASVHKYRYASEWMNERKTTRTAAQGYITNNSK